jgi:two-component system OmpR family response regulator
MIAQSPGFSRYDLRVAATVMEAAEALVSWQPEVAIVDLEGSGREVLRQIGRSGDAGALRVPVLALTRRADLTSKLAAFEQGVDDVLVIPFATEELIARLNVIARRHVGESTQPVPVLKLGALTVDVLKRQVTVGANEVRLSAMEMSVLIVLATHVGHVVSRYEMARALWGTDAAATTNAVDRHVTRLRAKLGDQGRRARFIATVYGRGYLLLPAPEGSDRPREYPPAGPPPQ